MNSKNNKFLLITIGILLIVSLSFSIGLISYEKIIVIKDLDEPKTTKFTLDENRFTLGYIHSVLLTPAEEMFLVNEDNQLLLQKTVYESFGVGLPYSRENYEFEIKDEKLILYVKREFPSLNMRISPIPKHWVQIGDEKIELLNTVSKEEDLIKIYARDAIVIRVGEEELIL